MTRQEIDELIRRWLKARLDEDRIRRLTPWHKAHLDERNQEFAQFDDQNGEPLGPFRQHEIEADEASVEREEWEYRLQLMDWARASHIADELLARERVELDRNGVEYKLVCQSVCRGMIEFYRIAKARALGDWQDEITDPLFQGLAELVPAIPMSVAQPAPAAPTRRTSETLAELMERCLSERGVIPKSQHDYRTALRALVHSMGREKQIDRITRQDVIDLKDALLKTPTNWTKRFPGKSLREAIALNEVRKLPLLAPKTVKMKYLTQVRVFLGWAKDNGYSSENPAEGVRITVPSRGTARKKRLPFEIDQLAVMFSAPLFVGCRSDARILDPGDYRVDDHRRWAPLLALFTGARVGELGQLQVGDVREIDGVHCIDLRDALDDDEERPAKHLKTEAAHRLVPLHPELVRLGLLDYVRRRRAKGDKRLFPRWDQGKDGYFSSPFSKWFARFCDAVVTKDRRFGFHSFRHTFITAMTRAGIEPDLRRAIVGHEAQDTHAATYMHPDARTLHAAIEKVAYSGLDLSHLYPGKPLTHSAT